jgi:hypothetical protein
MADDYIRQRNTHLDIEPAQKYLGSLREFAERS